jgi:hemoglobin
MNDDLMHHFFLAFSNPGLLEEHLQILVDFWDNILFYSGTYQKNAMKPHLDLQLKKPFKSEHFKQWLLHFNNTVDEHFEGEIAHAAKSRALSIATVMQIKITELGKQ